jgi:hypothetical protein
MLGVRGGICQAIHGSRVVGGAEWVRMMLGGFVGLPTALGVAGPSGELCHCAGQERAHGATHCVHIGCSAG